MKRFIAAALFTFALLITPIYSAETTNNVAGVQLQRRFVTSEDGTNIYAEAIGDRRNPAVVFIHGLGCSLVHFKKQFEDSKLRSSLYLIAYDMRGHGRSDGPLQAEAYESVRYAQDLKAVIDEFRVVKPFVAGWSLGGFVPADVVAAYGPSYISGVIILGFGLGPDVNLMEIVTTPEMRNTVGGLLSTELGQYRNASLEFSKGLYAPGFEVPREEQQRFMGGMLMMHPEAFQHSVTRLPVLGPITAARNTLPFLVIIGAQDTAINATAVRYYMTRNGFNMKFHELSGVGHSAFYEGPEKTNGLISVFVSKHV